MSASGSIAVVIGGGPIQPPDEQFVAVVAADSGVDVALAAGLTPTCVVGDLDSISAEGMRWACEHGVPLQRHDPDKDDTDTALAVRCAAAMRASNAARRLVVLGGHATDRFDHLLASVVCLGDPALGAFEHVAARLGRTEVHVLHPAHRLVLDVPVGRVFSLLALHGVCHGVSVEGARWPLLDADLEPASTLGVSNEASGGRVTVAVGAGVLTVIVPEVVA
jgi:thiamine pyrophosphokinase